MNPSPHMRWYYKVQGGHTHVSVFMNGGKCGDLCFRNEEFEEVKRKTGGPLGHHAIEFINEALPQHTNPGPVTRKTGSTPLTYGKNFTPKDEANVF